MSETTIEFDFAPADPKPLRTKSTFGANGPGKKGPGRPSGKATIEKELTEQIEMLITVVAIPISMRDEHCGPVLAENARPIAAALAAQATNSPALMKWLNALTAPTGWVGIAMALQPVAAAIIEHHVMPAFQKPPVDDETLTFVQAG